MAEYEVRFRDDFSGPARNAVDAVRDLKDSAAGAAARLAAMARSATSAGGATRSAAGGMRGMAASLRGSSSAAATWNANVAANVSQAHSLKRGIGGLTGAINAKASAANSAGGSVGGLGKKLGGLGAKANIAGIAIQALKVALAAVAIAAGIFAAQLTKAVMFLGRAQVAFRNLAHGAGNGARALKETMTLAADLGLPVQQTTKSMQKLLAMQFDKSTATEIIKMGAALKALGANTEEVDRVILAMSQIKSAGKLQGDELMQLAEAGVSVDLIYKNIGKQLGKTTEEVIKLKEAGKITADVAIAAIMEAVKDKGGVKNFQDLTKQVGKTLPGKIDLARSAWELFVIKVADFAQGPLLKSLGPIIDEVTSALRGAGKSGLLKGLGEAFGFVGEAASMVWGILRGFFSGLSSGLRLGGVAGHVFKALGTAILSILKSKIVVDLFQVWGAVLGGIISIVGILVSAIATLGSAAIWLFSAFNPIVRIGELVLNGLGQIPAFISGVAETIGAKASSLGSRIIDGIVNGIRAGVSAVVSAITDVANSAVSAAKSALKIKSPSQVFANIGSMVSQGFVKGVDQNAATNAMAFAATPAATPGAFAGGAGGGTRNSITIAVDPGSAVAAAERSKSPEEYAAAVRTMLANDLIDELELQLATIGGA